MAPLIITLFALLFGFVWIRKKWEEAQGRERKLASIQKEIDQIIENGKRDLKARKEIREKESALRKSGTIISSRDLEEIYNPVELEQVPPIVNPSKGRKRKKAEELEVNKKMSPLESCKRYIGRDPIIKLYKTSKFFLLVGNPQGINSLIISIGEIIKTGEDTEIRFCETDGCPYLFKLFMERKKKTGVNIIPAWEEKDPIEITASMQDYQIILETLKKTFSKNITHKTLLKTQSGYEFYFQCMVVNEGLGGEVWEEFPAHYEAEFLEDPDLRIKILKEWLL